MTKTVETGREPLRNPRREKFAQLMAEGSMSQTDAYKQAGYADDGSNAGRYAKEPEIVARIEYLQHEATRFNDVRRQRIVADLDHIAKVDPADFYETIDGKSRLKDIAKLPRELSICIASWTVKPSGETTIKLKDGLAATTTLLKFLGGLPETTTQPNVTNIFNVLTADDQRAIADALEAAAAAERDADLPTEDERGSDRETP